MGDYLKIEVDAWKNLCYIGWVVASYQLATLFCLIAILGKIQNKVVFFWLTVNQKDIHSTMMHIKRIDTSMHVLGGQHFTWHQGRGCAELSDFNCTTKGDNLFNGCPRFAIKSHRTGVEKTFELFDKEFDREGDLVYIMYKSEDGTTTIRLYND